MYSSPSASPAPQAAYLSYFNQPHATNAASAAARFSHNHSHSHHHAHSHTPLSAANGVYSHYAANGGSATPGTGNGGPAVGTWPAPRTLGQNSHQQHPSLSSLVGSSAGALPGSPVGFPATSRNFPPLNSPSLLHTHAHSPAHSHAANGAGSLSSAVISSPHWKAQIKGAEIARQSGSPHHHARAAAVAARTAGAGVSVADASKTLLPANGLRPEVLKPCASDPSFDEPLSSPAKRTIPGRTPRETDEDQSWTQLDLGGMRLRALAPELFRYDFLTSLFINHNELTSIAPDIAKLKHLEVLDASHNRLTLLPPELGLLPGLKELYLFDNAITVLPPQLGMLYQLEMLGIEGNPLDREQLSEIQQNGTISLIHSLRDNGEIPPAPQERRWITLPSNGDDADDTPKPTDERESLSIMGYNVLADKLATEAIFGYTPSWALTWDYRKQMIVTEIQQQGADMVCLQEVGMQQYDEFFAPLLHTHGYAGVYYAKSRVKTMRDEEKRRVDGCAVFYKRSKFHLVDKHVIEYGQACLQRDDFRASEDVYNRVMPRDQVGVICCFEYRESGAKLLVANTHLHWDPAYSDVKLVQAAMLMDELQRAADAFCKRKTDVSLAADALAPAYADGNAVPIFLCGDLNSEPSSGVFEYLSTGHLDGQHEDFLAKTYGDITSKGLEHRLQLKSSYGEIGELPFTNFTPGYVGVLEYLFYSVNTVEPKALLGPVDEEYASKCVGFPNAHFPSDHIPLVAKYSIPLPKGTKVVRPKPRSDA